MQRQLEAHADSHELAFWLCPGTIKAMYACDSLSSSCCPNLQVRWSLWQIIGFLFSWTWVRFPLHPERVFSGRIEEGEAAACLIDHNSSGEVGNFCNFCSWEHDLPVTGWSHGHSQIWEALIALRATNTLSELAQGNLKRDYCCNNILWWGW